MEKCSSVFRYRNVHWERNGEDRHDDEDEEDYGTRGYDHLWAQLEVTIFNNGDMDRRGESEQYYSGSGK